MVEVLYPSCAAIDVHKKTAVAAVSYPDQRGGLGQADPHLFHHDRDLQAMVASFLEKGVTHVAMESTGI